MLGNIFDGTIFSDPEKFFGDLLEIPRWLIADVIPRILGALVEVLTFGMVKNGEQFIHGIMDAVKDGALGLQEPVIEADETKREALSDENIQSQIGTYALHLEPAYKNLKRAENLDNSEKLFFNAITLPLHKDLTYEDQEKICR